MALMGIIFGILVFGLILFQIWCIYKDLKDDGYFKKGGVMKWNKVFSKGLLGILTFVFAYLASNLHLVLNIIPDNIEQMTIGAIVSGLIVAITNWLKHRAG